MEKIHPKMHPKYNVGDIVILRKFPKNLYPRFVTDMEGYIGESEKIKSVLYKTIRNYEGEESIVLYEMENGFFWREDYMDLSYEHRVETFKKRLKKISL